MDTANTKTNRHSQLTALVEECYMWHIDSQVVAVGDNMSQPTKRMK